MARSIDSSPPRDENREELDLQEFWNVILRNRWLILGVTGTFLGLSVLLTRSQKPVYESAASLAIEDSSPSAGMLGDLSLAGGGKDRIETDMIILRSRQIAEEVVDSLALHVRLLDPARPRDEVLTVLSAPASANPAVYTFERQRNGSYALLAEGTGAASPLSSSVQPGQPFRLAEVSIALNPSIRDSDVSRIRIEITPFRKVVEALRKGMDVSRPNPKAGVVAIRYANSDPLLAAAVPNVASSSFIEHKSRTSKSESKSTVEFLREQVGNHAVHLRAAESALRTYREQAQIVNPAESAIEQVRQLANLRAQRDGVLAERNALAKLLADATNSRPNDLDGTQPSPYRQLASFPIFLTNPAIQNVLQSITELENERAQLLVRRTPTNADVRGVNRRVEELEMQLYRTAQSYLESLDRQLASLDANLSRFSSEMAQVPARELEFARLLREQMLMEELYTLLQKRLKEAEIQQAVEPSSVRVIDEALTPDEPISPRPLRNLFFGGMLGLAFGIGGAFVRRALDTKVRTTEDAEVASGGLPVLGVIPRIRAKASTSGNLRRLQIRKIVPPPSEQQIEERLITHRDPRSPVSESYRAVRTNITFMSAERAPRILAVTSAMPGDGKSTSAANLAVTLAQQGVRVLLVDADLRKGLLHRIFGMAQEPGLTHVLLGYRSLDDTVQEIGNIDSDIPLHFLASGIFPPNPAELIGSDRMRSLVEDLRSRYEMVIFDAPPLNLVTDAAILGTLMDATILVTRAGVTEKGALQHAAAQLQRVGAPVGGVILNDFAATGGHVYGHYGYGMYASSKGNGRNG